jgi:hypothetical protein
MPYAIAHYLGGAKHESEVLVGYAKALGYRDFKELNKALADLLRDPDREDEQWGLRARAHNAQRQLLGKFVNDLRRASPAALAKAADRIVSTLPEELRAMIRSARKISWDTDARVNQILEVAEKGVACAPNQTAPRR